ncbi:MAG: hypothetical protein ACE5GA_06080 [Candidatus Zixiibacteriota bacterium]
MDLRGSRELMMKIDDLTGASARPAKLRRGAHKLSALIFAALFALVQVSPTLAQQNDTVEPKKAKKDRTLRSTNVIVDFNDLRSSDLLVQGFELSDETRLTLTAVGAAPRGSDELSAYAWILDAETREPVWVMDRRDTDRLSRSRTLREIEDQLTLPSGRYEAYYYVGRPHWGSFSIDTDDWAEFWRELEGALEELGDELGDAFDDDDDDYDADDDDRDRGRRKGRARDRDWDDFGRRFKNGSLHSLTKSELRELHFTVNAHRATFTIFNPEDALRETIIVDFRKVSDDERLQKGFSLARETKLTVRAGGEYSEGGNVFVDQGWIVDANTRQRVWEMDKWSTRYAGGARKNRYVQEEVTLPEGDYLVYYMSDDSHSFDDWNATPPYDPLSYGISVMVSDRGSKGNVSDYTYNPQETVIFALDRVGNHEFESQGFSLKKETDLRILCLGEFAFNEFADYGWIENVETMETVWEMTEDNTDHAGGATKNRVFDDVISLPAGDYMSHYVTDGSHSYRSWNSAKPFEPKKWGLTIYGVGKKFERDDIALFSDLPEGSQGLVNLTKVGDDMEVSDRFTLTEETTVRVFALGEGSGNRMYDYGWIENVRTGRTVWKMRYRRTRHAGGAKKNRLVNTTLDLGPGEYEVVFVTDGSHSFERFNAGMPRSPQKWGISVSKK